MTNDNHLAPGAAPLKEANAAPGDSQIVLNPVAGQKYMIYHYRFGRAVVKVHNLDKVWAYCEIISGTLRGMGRGAVWRPGEMKSVRIDQATWTPVEES